MNYSTPANSFSIEQEQELNQHRKADLDTILTQEVLISYLSNGITYSDIEQMDEYERLFVINKLIAMKKEENEARKQAIENMNK